MTMPASAPVYSITEEHCARAESAAWSRFTAPNELARRLRCDRVSIGFGKAGQIVPLVLSHTASFDRRSDLVRTLGEAMDEVLDLGGRHAATVKIVDKVIDAASGTFVARLELPNPTYTLPGGLRCQAEFESLTVPPRMMPRSLP